MKKYYSYICIPMARELTGRSCNTSHRKHLSYLDNP